MDLRLALAASRIDRYDRSTGVLSLDAPEGPWDRTIAMTARTAVTLRLLGPLIEVVCLIVLLKYRDQGRQFAGVPLEYLLYAGLAIGFGLVVIGLFFSRPAPRRPRDSG